MPSTHLWKPVLAEILSCNLLFLPSLFKHSHFTLCKLNVRKKTEKIKNFRKYCNYSFTFLYTDFFTPNGLTYRASLRLRGVTILERGGRFLYSVSDILIFLFYIIISSNNISDKF